MNFAPEEFFDLTGFGHRALFRDCVEVWEVLRKISAYVRQNVRPDVMGNVEKGAFVSPDVFLGRDTVVESFAYVRGPAIIGANCQIRSGAYIRGDVLVGDDCVIGNATELKNTIMLNGAVAPHYNYCGDSVLGNNTNLGAGTKLSNYKIGPDKTIRLRVDGEIIDTELEKFGAILGDGASTGCNAVLNPGTILGKGVMVYANAAVRGYVPHFTIVKLRQTLDHAERV
ncbi:MAG: LbetaH domain-containing protein [Planctomycetota bacterium]|jgi:NDP-sugar pyrophosphorylase family protein